MSDELEKQLNQDDIRNSALSSSAENVNAKYEDEINFKDLWQALWNGKWIIIITVTIFSIVAVVYALSLPDIYKSEALLSPANDEKKGDFGSLVGQFGGLASIAGVNLSGTGTNKTILAIEVLKSREFFSKFMEKHKALPDLMAVKSWDYKSNSLTYDDEVYSVDTGEWLREVAFPKQAKPSLQEAKKEFDKILSIQQSEDTGMIKIGIEHASPYIAKEWVDGIIEAINLEIKIRDKREAEKSISYLQSQIDDTAISQHRTLLYQLIEEQAKTLMFAEVRDEYVFKTIDSALVTEEKHSPKRALIAISGFLFGGVISTFFVLVRHFTTNEKY